MSIPISLRAAALASVVFAAGLGVPCVMAIRNLAAGRGIPYVLGYPAYGGGAFERHGIATTIPLLVGFLAVCLLEAVAAGYLWGGHRIGAYLALGLMLPGAVYWWGFDLPYPPVMAVVQIVLLAVGWSGLVGGG